MASTEYLSVGGGTMEAYVDAPAGAGPHPAMVVTHHRGGLDAFTRMFVEDLAAAGYVAAALAFYHRRPAGEEATESMAALDDAEMIADMTATVDYLQGRADVRADAVGIVGHCMGGRTTWVGLVSLPGRWKCGCVWYGGGAFNAMGKVAAPAERLGAIDCPVAGYFGNEDGNPSPDDVNKFDDMLTQLGKPHEFHRYDGAGHGFMSSSGPERYRETQAKDSWAKGLEFLARHLQP